MKKSSFYLVLAIACSLLAVGCVAVDVMIILQLTKVWQMQNFGSLVIAILFTFVLALAAAGFYQESVVINWWIKFRQRWRLVR